MNEVATGEEGASHDCGGDDDGAGSGEEAGPAPRWIGCEIVPR
jgi:hypothetical protein